MIETTACRDCPAPLPITDGTVSACPVCGARPWRYSDIAPWCASDRDYQRWSAQLVAEVARTEGEATAPDYFDDKETT